MIAYFDDFIEKNGCADANIDRLNNDASRRIYYRISGSDKNYIMCDSSEELKALQKTIHTNKIFQDINLKVPQIINADTEKGYMLMEDFGNNILNQVITPTNATEYYRKLLDILCEMQKKTRGKQLPLDLYNQERMNKELMKFCDFFLVRVLPIQEFSAATDELMKIFEEDLYPMLDLSNPVLIHRDFHVDNLVLCEDGEIGILDFQDAVMGDAAYDVVCLLQDARRYINPEFEAEMLQYFSSITKYDEEQFKRSYNVLGLQKNLKIIGIFTNLYRNEGRKIYHDRCDIVWEYIKRLKASAPSLSAWFEKYKVFDHHEEI